MAKGEQFNKGILDIKQTDVIWKIPTSEVHCVSINELDYLKENRNFALPLNNIQLNEKQLQFSWTIPKGYRPIESVRKESAWYQLKTAKNLLEVIQNFNQDSHFKTVYELENFYIDEYFNVKVLFYTHHLHLPYESNEVKVLHHLQKNLANIFTIVDDKKIATYKEKEFSKDKNPKSALLTSIFQSRSIQELWDLIEREYDHYLALQDKQQMIHESEKKKQRHQLILSFLGIFAVVIVTWYFLSNSSTNQLKSQINELEGDIQDYQTLLDSYDAYFAGDPEKALEIIQEVNEDADYLNEIYYAQLLVANDQVEEALKDFPKIGHFIVDQFVLSAENDEILTLDVDHPHMIFEQAIINEDDDVLMEVIPELNDLTDRQKSLVFEFYLRTDIDAALSFAQQHKNSNWTLEALETKQENLKAEVKKLDQKKGKKKNKKKIKNKKKEIKKISKEIKALKG